MLLSLLYSKTKHGKLSLEILQHENFPIYGIREQVQALILTSTVYGARGREEPASARSTCSPRVNGQLYS